ncbi:Lcl2p KNAG_0G02230 [Huiozyma naganishii CBS 8797]|uniref:Long chronological lifespan protein 2 n=1 Tax=Huiozyma naganishii (strain ATCC MYA-139 / BCRC 22969 / CBS 8797 / KCTC 17520 / NBRC 10181 / NCYC 3082 / Yp74L-3) TaxID=1071383 RepID=J7S936_HUIN7|nr:hypothetical protein KNAG_0G02230 [Kazachstania naganishii CBS 8797]CCK71281.1 hypothetical protein KNAG_0G02230 [Kazachstania naganishii CBS 8797]
MLKSVFFMTLLWGVSTAFMFDFHHQQRQQQQQQQEQQRSYEDRVLDNECPNYLCPDTLQCVKEKKDCPCPFSKSQLKCELPNGDYLCISKPATHDQKLNEQYDDSKKGPQFKAGNGIRDCGWILDVYQGKI